MKMAKKFLAVALAGVLALSVLTGCGASVKSKDIADSLTKMGVKVEQSKDVDKTAENTLKAIETIIAADSANKITLDNAVEKVTGKVISQEHIDVNTDATGAVQKALGVLNSGSDAEKANVGKQVRVALVEIKNAKLGFGSKAGHLSYLGDSEIGADVNIGAGTITCNYDGANKWKTVLGADVFIGSNNSLVAPVDISNGATTAAGSTINQDVAAEQLAVGRARQRNIDGWKRPVKQPKP